MAGLTGSPAEELGAAAAWERLRRIRTAGDAEAAGLVPDGHGGLRWGQGASPQAAELAERYPGLCLAGPRVAFAQLGQSLDGFIATRTGDADFVTGEEDRLHLHRLRALADAVLVGAGTAVSDDPQLTVRACAGRNPVRVVLDPRGRVPLGRKVFTDGAAPTLWVVGPEGQRALRGPDTGAGPHVEVGPNVSVGPHVDVLVLPDAAAFAPSRLLDALARRGLGRVLVEGGGVTVSRFLAARALHRLYVTVAPVLLGDGVPGLRFPGTPVMRDALRPPLRRAMLGEDTLFELDLRVPGAQSGGPPDDEDPGARQARGEGEHPVDHGRGESLSGA
ncbi:RibD family protein [Streptomyces piniterrae]|uniref:RibD family protein n=2 Tax=Streptomyces piniterrae TaxID=2571125 RepID=A0A4V6WHU3_9ACTN|nr:RibD family protein [Streptomyces piniterrae]